MKYIVLISALALVAACASKKTSTESENKEMATPTAMASDTLIQVKRGGCYGKCPMDYTTFLVNGEVLYTGKKFVDNVGNFKTTISNEALVNIKAGLKSCDFFNLAERYPENPAHRITDLPTVILTAYNGAIPYQIHNSHDAPKELIDFQKMVITLINEMEFK